MSPIEDEETAQGKDSASVLETARHGTLGYASRPIGASKPVTEIQFGNRGPTDG